MFCLLFTLIRSAWLNCSALCDFPYVLNTQWTFTTMRFFWISLLHCEYWKIGEWNLQTGLFLGGYCLKNSLNYIHDYLAYPARIPNYWLHGYKSEEITKQPSSVWNTLKHELVGMNTVWMGTLYVCLRICVRTTVLFLALLISNCQNCHWWLLFRVLNFFLLAFPSKVLMSS